MPGSALASEDTLNGTVEVPVFMELRSQLRMRSQRMRGASHAENQRKGEMKVRRQE